MNMARKSVAAERRECRKLRRDGLTREEIAAKTGLSVRTVARRLGNAEGQVRAMSDKTAATAVVSSSVVATAQPTEPMPELTRANLRTWVQGHMAGLQAEVDRATAAGDFAAAERARRMLSSVAPLAARVAKDDPADDSEWVRVRVADMDECGKRGADKLRDMLAKGLAERATWPRCPGCGQPVCPDGGSNEVGG